MPDVRVSTFFHYFNGNGSTEGSVPVNTKTYKTGDTIRVAGNNGSLKKKIQHLPAGQGKLEVEISTVRRILC
jgi:hypothetical protein